MPLWIIYHTDDAFVNDDAKGALARDITKHYTNDVGLPAFYVVVNHIQLRAQDMWVGGERHAGGHPFVRITIDHAAVSLLSDDGGTEHRRLTAAFDRILKPHVADRGYRWEFRVNEVEVRLWKINGFIPPAHGSAGEKLWLRENKPVPYKS